jgi:hypothetical protein
VLAWSAAMVLGLTIRLLSVTAARPYIAYVDEGHFLHPVLRMIRDRAWDPGQYVYPQFPHVAVASMGRLVDALASLVGIPSLRDRIPRKVEIYDELEPFAFLVTARALTVAAGLGIVALTGILARRLAGPVAGAAAALLAAFAPALVLRGSIATVDSYAALAVIAALSVADSSRTSETPALTAFAAGALAGVAFASKYPAVLVFLAVAVTILLLPSTGWDKLRRVSAAMAGLVAGASAAMPALWSHAAEIRAALLNHWAGYRGRVADPSLWRQTLFRAESNLRYDGPELGVLFCLLALAGLGIGMGRRELRPTFVGGCAFAAAMLLLFANTESRPFRNLLPLVPAACVAAGIGYAGIRSRTRRTLAVDAAGIVLLVILFVVPMTSYALWRRGVKDPRRLAVDWLAANARPEDTVVIVRDLAILDGEVARVPGRIARSSWGDAPARIRTEAPRLVVAGVRIRSDHSLDAAATWPELAGYRRVLDVGATPTPPFRSWWRGNAEIVVVFERRAPG